MAKSFPAKTAWHGVSVITPDDWGLAGASGERDKGYLRVDSPGETIVEIRWSAAKAAPNLVTRANELLGSLRGAAKKNKVNFTSKVETKKDPEPGTPVRFTWKGDRNGYGRINYCEKCRRVVLAQVSSARNENVSGFANEILDSVTDHGEDGWIDWALFGVRTAVPEDFNLVKQTLLSGHFSLQFVGKYGELTLQQWGLASSLIRKSSLAEWYKSDVLARNKKFVAELEPVDDLGHETLQIDGRRIGAVEKMKTVLKSVTLRPLSQKLSGFVWHCPESNRIVSIRLSHDDENLAEEIRRRTGCHRG